MKAITALGVLLSLAIAAMGIGEDSSKRVSGRVLDYRSKRDQPVGIPGVIVEAYDVENNLLSQALTDTAGRYVLEGLEPDKATAIQHRKIGYLRDPEVWKGTVGAEEVTVYMAKRNADRAYYRDVGEAIEDRSARNYNSCITVEHYELCDPFVSTDVEALKREWANFLQLGVSPEQRHAAREVIASDWYSSHILYSIEAKVTASQVASLSPVTATDIVRDHGFLPDIYFDFDTAELSEDARERLSAATVQFFQASSFVLVIEGHADERGTNEYNLALGERRASAVRDYLSHLGLDASRMRTLAFGEEHPACTMDSEACYAQNRRVQLRLE